ncbi:MAG: hypothetical protein ACYDBB_05630 [Armatimonadota bacterium]
MNYSLPRTMLALLVLTIMGAASAQYTSPQPSNTQCFTDQQACLTAIQPTTNIYVLLDENGPSLDRTMIPTGNVTLYVYNNGIMPHTLTITGPGVAASTYWIDPGYGTTLSLANLPGGTYTALVPQSTNPSVNPTTTLVALDGCSEVVASR